MNNTRLPSIIQIISIDYLAITMAVVPIALWALLGVVYIMPAALDGKPVDLSSFLILLLLALTAFCWLALAWRVSKIRAVFAAGIHVKGIITGIWFFRNRGQMCFSYNYQGSIHDARMTLVKNQRSLALKEGAMLELLVDPDNAERTFLQDLFI